MESFYDSFPPSQANSLAIFSFVEFLKGELRHISILQMASQIVFLFTSLVKIYSSWEYITDSWKKIIFTLFSGSRCYEIMNQLTVTFSEVKIK